MSGNHSNMYKEIFEQLNAGALIINTSGVIQFVNRAYCKMSGYKIDEVIGKKLDNYIEGPQKMDQLWEGEVFLKQKGKALFPKWMYVNPVTGLTGKNQYSILLFRDFQSCGYDPLTKLPNRLSLQQQLNQSIKKAKEKSIFVAVLYIDLDRFKFINDTLGHSCGDLLLQETANRIKKSIGNSHFVYRIGGDEFICVLDDLKDESEAETCAEAIIQAFSKPILLKNTELFITLSIGISLFPYDGDEVETLITNADSAMYHAKRNGRNQYERVKVNENAGAFEKLLLENSLRKAIKENELTLYFQPQFDIKTNKIKAMEALIRWVHPELGLISPGDFIPIAEETGLILFIDDWVLRTACTKMKEWRDAGLPPTRIAVNLSAAKFMQTNLVDQIDQILEDTSLDPNYLELEITENMVMHDVNTAIEVLRQLQDRGIYLSIDDFGTGYSSLNYLKELPVDTIKIDRSFIMDIDKNKDSLSLTKAIVTLAHNLNLSVTAEGVENEQQLSLIKKQSCDMAQGYYFSKPLTYEEIVQYVHHHSRATKTV